MSKIVWKNFADDKATYVVTSVRVDDQSSLIEITSQKGSKVDTMVLSMEHAQEIGFINFDKLNKLWQ